MFREHEARPERLGELVHGNPGRADVVLDEVQRVPSARLETGARGSRGCI